MGAQQKPDKILSAQEVADYLGVSRLTVYREIKRGRLRAVRIREVLRITPEALTEYLRACEVA